jgi:hypothetical protein
LSVPAPNTTTTTCDIALASGSSSWSPGCSIAASSSSLVQLTAGMLNYWAPSAPQPSEEYASFAVGDGAGVSNTNLISLLQRNVSTIIAFVSSSTPLQNSSHWNPAIDDLLEDSIDFTVPAWFGQIPTDLQPVWELSYDLPNSHVFEDTEWLPFITALQVAQASGSGNVISMTHTTVANVKYGIEAGRKVKVVWAYLGRALGWESLLNDEMKALVVPQSDSYNQANTIAAGPFASFPNYPTALANIGVEQANLLSDFTGWMVYQNQNIFRDALGLPLVPDDSGSLSEDDDGAFLGSIGGIVTLSCVTVLIAIVLLLYCYRSHVMKTCGNSNDDNCARLSEMSEGLVKNDAVSNKNSMA